MSLNFNNQNWVCCSLRLLVFFHSSWCDSHVYAHVLVGFWHLLIDIRHVCVCKGQLVWWRHALPPPPSHHVFRATCMQILPLVEMFCRWELQKDCSNLRSLMLRFDSEVELNSHELGRSLLCMLRDDDIGLDGLHIQEARDMQTNPFDELRSRLAAADFTIHSLRP